MDIGHIQKSYRKRGYSLKYDKKEQAYFLSIPNSEHKLYLFNIDEIKEVILNITNFNNMLQEKEYVVIEGEKKISKKQICRKILLLIVGFLKLMLFMFIIYRMIVGYIVYTNNL